MINQIYGGIYGYA